MVKMGATVQEIVRLVEAATRTEAVTSDKRQV